MSASVQYESIAVAAARLGISSKTLRRHISQGKITAYRVGRLIRLNPAEVDALMHRIPSSAA